MLLFQMLRDNVIPGVCLRFWKDKHQLKKSRSESTLATEDELKRLEVNITRLIAKLSHCSDEVPKYHEEECVICISGRASIQTFPCGHIVLCRKCFIKTVQLAVTERNLPLRCVVCRTRIVRLKQQVSSYRPVILRTQPPTPGTIPLNPSSLWTANANRLQHHSADCSLLSR